MGDYVVIRPEDGRVAQQVSGWADSLMAHADFARHNCVAYVDAGTPANRLMTVGALSTEASVSFYFGHGNETSWLESGDSILDAENIQATRGKAVVSVACKTGCILAGQAITAGATSWLGFTSKVPVLPTHLNLDPIGEAFVAALSKLGVGVSVHDVLEALMGEFDNLVQAYDSGTVSKTPQCIGRVLCLHGHAGPRGASSVVPAHGTAARATLGPICRRATPKPTFDDTPDMVLPR